MEAPNNNLKDMPKGNPFRVPDNYFETLTDRIMQQIPEETPMPVAEKVTLVDRIRPLLYLAAMFAGMAIFFKALVFIESTDTAADPSDSLLVSNDLSGNAYDALREVESNENEYLQYLEEQYTDALLLNEMGDE